MLLASLARGGLKYRYFILWHGIATAFYGRPGDLWNGCRWKRRDAF